MTAYLRAAAGIAALALLVFSENLFGRELNAFFLAAPGIDKLLHTLEYFAVFVCVYVLCGRATDDRRKRLILAASVGVLLSAADELVQQLAPARNVEMFDLIADWAGVTLGFVAVSRPSRRIALAATTVALASVAYVAYDTHVRLIDYSRALRYERDHNFARAREYYLRAVAAGLRTADVYNGLAWVAVESGVGDPAEAVSYARRALDLQPGNPDVLDTYGWALHRAGRTAEGLQYLEEAFAKKPQMYCIHYHLGDAYRALGRRDLAELHLRRQGDLPGTREAGLARQALASMGSHQ